MDLFHDWKYSAKNGILPDTHLSDKNWFASLYSDQNGIFLKAAIRLKMKFFLIPPSRIKMNLLRDSRYSDQNGFALR